MGILIKTYWQKLQPSYMKNNSSGYTKLLDMKRTVLPAGMLSRMYGRSAFLMMLILTLFAGAAHLLLGASPLVIVITVATILLSFLPMAYYGIYNLAALLVALVGMRFIGFPLFLKLFFLQPLDSNLSNPIGTVTTVFIGTIGYAIASTVAIKLPVGKRVLQPVMRRSFLDRIALYAFIVAILTNLAVALGTRLPSPILSVAKFYVSFIYLALIGSIAKSYLKKGMDISVFVIFLTGIMFGITRNARSVILFTLISFFLTSQIFRVKLNFKKLVIISVTLGLLFLYLSPIFLLARSQRSSRTWQEQIQFTLKIATNWQETFTWYQQYQAITSQYLDGLSGHLTYYGQSTNALDRVSYISTVDIFKVGADRYGTTGFEDIKISALRATPSFFAPNKPTEFGHGSWLFSQAGISALGYPVATLIGAGYMAFGWLGAFLYPLVLGSVLLLVIKKVSGLSMLQNIWAIYFFIRIQNFFIEGASDTFIALIIRDIPQDLFLILLIVTLSKLRLTGITKQQSATN